MKTLELPAALEAAGVEVRLLDGWKTAHYSGKYKWREADGEPAGHMWHHTASGGYTPNRDKANGWAGLGSDDSLRLYQSGGGRPIYAIANAHPGPITSGYGCRYVLEKFVKRDIAFTGRQPKADDTDPKWAGNTHYWNTEVVLDGVGTYIDDDVWAMMVTVGQVQNELFGWTPARHIGHAMHSNRKIDLRDGRFKDMAQTLDALRLDMAGAVVIPPVEPPIEPPTEDYMYIPVEYTDGFNSNPAKRAAVAGFQGALKIKGFSDGNSQSPDGVDGKYGNGTIAACKAFQKSVGFKVTGMGDVKTRAKAEE